MLINVVTLFLGGGRGGFTTNLDSNRNIWTKIYKHKAAVSTSRTISTDVFSINVVICARRLRSRDSGGSRRSRRQDPHLSVTEQTTRRDTTAAFMGNTSGGNEPEFPLFDGKLTEFCEP